VTQVVHGGNGTDRLTPEHPEHTRILLVGAFDEALHAHTALRRRALERLGCRVTAFNLMGDGGILSRFKRESGAVWVNWFCDE
jgi:hypothetical protein